MTWDFSNVDPQGEAPEIRQAFYSYLNQRIQKFALYYQAWLSVEIEIHSTDAQASFQSLLTAVQFSDYPLYLLIDEYDNFANEVMMVSQRKVSPSRYKALLLTEGSLKAFFKTIKSASSGNGLEKVFITGVSPVLMSDITSAYNVAKDIYFELKFNDLCGFTENEIKDILSQIVKNCGFENDKMIVALRLIKTFYDGYRFNEITDQAIYNPTLALYFLAYFQEYCQFPRLMLDNNLAMDRGKLSYLSSLLNGKSVILQALNENPPLSLLELANRFGLHDMLNTSKDNSFIISLLYYLGILTLNGETELGKLRFKIPNLVVRKLYVERLFETFLPEETERFQAHLLAEDFYQTGDLQPICDFMEQRYFRVFDNRDYTSANELTIKTAFLTVLFDDVFYIMDSELPLQGRYADLTMMIRPGRHHSPIYDFILEFKYLSLSQVGLSGEKVRELSIDELKALVLVKQKLGEAKKQLFDYQTRLESKYGDSLKLQLISVAAVGFERVVWEKVL